jgi:ribonuclease P protein component
MTLPAPRNTFRKSEKLCSQTRIDRLFREGRSISSGAFRLIYLISAEALPPAASVLIAVPKKNLKLAVDRNRMKRLIREAYRHEKHPLLAWLHNAGLHCDLALVFGSRKCISQAETRTAINELLGRLIQKHEKNTQ